MSLAVVRSLGAPRRLGSAQEVEDFEQELIDQFLLAGVGAGLADHTVGQDRSVIFEFVRFLGGPLWTAQPVDADRYLAQQRREGRARLTVQKKAWALGRFYEFLIARHQGDIQALTGYVVGQLIDEFNRPAQADYGAARVPPSMQEVERLFDAWRAWLPTARKFLPAARDYLAASLWRRVGLRIGETYMLDIRDWRRDLGEYGKLHVRFGKGSRGRGPKTRLVPAIDSAAIWWSGGWLTCGTSSATTGPMWTLRCCRVSGTIRTPATAGGSGIRRCGTVLPRRSTGGCRRGRGG